MKLDYIPLASVPTAESLGASAKVLVVDDGEIKKTAKANVGEHPSGKLTITGTSEVNCAAYATAQVSDENLVAGNIKKDVTILGTTGAYEGGGGGFMGMQTATITCNFTAPEGYTLDKLAPSWRIVFDYSTYQKITGMVYSDSLSSAVVPIIPNETTELEELNVIAIENVEHNPVALYPIFADATLTGGLTYNSETGCIEVTGDGTITANLSVPD